MNKGLANLPKDIELVSLGSLWRMEHSQPLKPYQLIFGFEPALSSTPPFENLTPLLRGIPQD